MQCRRDFRRLPSLAGEHLPSRQGGETQMSVATHSLMKTLAFTAAAALLVACGGGGSDGTKDKTGMLKLGITDAPVDDAYAVNVQFTGIELKPKAGEAFSIDFSAPKNIDLLAFQGADRTILLNEPVPAGEYEWMRLKVSADPNVGGDSYLQLTSGGQQCEIRIPSGDQTGLKMIRGFVVGVGTTTDFTIDFDLRKSLVAPPGQKTPVNTCGNQAYMLKPVLRVVDTLQVGTISGLVDPNLIQRECVASTTPPYPGSVYLFQVVAPAADVTPDDYDGVADDPNGADAIASAKVDPNTFAYTIGFVPVGNYEVAYTCDLDDATLDADVVPTPPATGETVDFTPSTGQAVVVSGSHAVQANIAAPPAP
jgi:hypothetical protein